MMDKEKIRTILAYVYLAVIVVVAIMLLSASRG